MRTMKASEVHEWLVTNHFLTPAKALREKFVLAGHVEIKDIEDLFAMYFKRPSYIFRQMECDVTTTLHFNLP